MAVYLGNKKVGVTIEKEKIDMLQARVDKTNSCEYLFYNYGGENLDFLKGLDTSKVTDMSYMFNGCNKLTELDLSSFDTSKVTDMEYMFSGCNKLTELDLSSFDTSNVITMNQMFYYCSKLTSLDFSKFNTSKVTNMAYMFGGCSLLENILNLNMISVTNGSSVVSSCPALKNLYLKNIRVNLYIGEATKYGTLLTNESLINTFKELWDYSGTSTTKKLTLSTTSKENIANIYVKLVDVTDEMLAEDEYAGNKKPCVVCESTDEGAMTLTEYATSKNWAIA